MECASYSATNFSIFGILEYEYGWPGNDKRPSATDKMAQVERYTSSWQFVSDIYFCHLEGMPAIAVKNIGFPHSCNFISRHAPVVCFQRVSGSPESQKEANISPKEYQGKDIKGIHASFGHSTQKSSRFIDQDRKNCRIVI